MLELMHYLSHFNSLLRSFRPQRVHILSIVLVMVPGYCLAQGGSCPSTWKSIDPSGNSVSIASYAGIKSCYYASKSTGSDTAYDGTQETVNGAHGPWAHIPGMNGCTGNCSAHTPAAGEGFVLRGGDTWTGSDLGVNWNWGGSGSGSQIYIGVDAGWYSGSSWTRPIWNLSGIGANAFLADGSKSYWWLDNIEITGMQNGANGVYVQGAGNIRASQLYFHGWTHTGNSNNVGFFSQGGPGATADHNVIDGSDSSKNTFNAFYGYWSTIEYNYIRYVVSGLIGSSDTVHDNVLSNTVSSVDGDHCNGFFTFSPESGNSQLIYNNVVDMGTACPGGVQVWFNGNGSTNASWIGFGFGNIIYNTTGGNLINIGNHGSGNYGAYYIFNNSVDCSNGGCGGVLPNGPYFSVYEQNNYVIGGPYLALDTSASGGSVLGPCVSGVGTGCTDLSQSATIANKQGYSSAELYPYQPVSTCTQATCSTVNAGTNLTSAVCTKLSSIDASAYNACLSGTSAGVSYNATTHSVTNPNVPLNSRSSTGAWDIGAYQFAKSSGPPAPSNLSLTLTSGASGAVKGSTKDQ